MRRRVIILILLLIALGVIVFLSVQSSDVSEKIDAFYMEHFPIWMVFPPVHLFGHPVTMREGAHVYEYFALGIIAMLFFIKKEHRVRQALYAWLSCAIISNLDQFSKIFIPGREYAVTDLIYDALGYTIGISLILLLNSIYSFIKHLVHKKREDNPS